MIGTDIATLIISLMSLLISMIVAYKTYIFGKYQLRLGNRNEFQKMLVDISKTLVEHPELWAIYDLYPVPREWLADPMGKAKLQAFAHMVLNVCECVFAYYGDSSRLSKAERKDFDTWKGFLRDTLQKSSFARELVSNPNIRSMYHAKLLTEIDSILES
jgi:hypothetical protein